jgi:hypothetical protein
MSEHLITTKAEIQACTRCRRITLHGISEGLTATVDPAPIARADEPAIHANGIPTYSLRAGRLDYRDPDIPPTDPAPILATHICPKLPEQGVLPI